MRAYYTDGFVLPLPEGHRFPMEKYSRLRSLVADHPRLQLLIPPRAQDAELLRAHTPGYLERVGRGLLDRQEVRRLGFPWSPELVERSRRSVGATLAAGRDALQDGLAANLAGGTHHAFADRGEGFCVFNDSIVALRSLQAEGGIATAMVVDCDVHQGNGTAHLAAADPTIFTFSIHGRHNYPFHKERSDLDMELPDGADDSCYLDTLRQGLELALERFRPDLAIYIAGADPHENDRLGRLAVTREGLAERDRYVLDRLRGLAIPVVITMGGGYGRDLEDTAAIHAHTVRYAADLA